ncbi:unnamed protein product [Amoebophrya sp. A120]|nr:unnamed protein product [Amoebophrya sp. A120]|eukprot:GSA120T00000170001.1
MSPFRNFKRHLETHICAYPEICRAWEQSGQQGAAGTFQLAAEAFQKAPYENWKQKKGKKETVDLFFLHEIDRHVTPLEYRWLGQATGYTSKRFTFRNAIAFTSNQQWVQSADALFLASVRFLQQNTARVQAQLAPDVGAPTTVLGTPATGGGGCTTSGAAPAGGTAPALGAKDRSTRTPSQLVHQLPATGDEQQEEQQPPVSRRPLLTRKLYKRTLIVGCIPFRFHKATRQVRIAFVRAKHTHAPELPKGKVTEQVLQLLSQHEKLHQDDFELVADDYPKLKDEALRELAEETGLRQDVGDFSSADDANEGKIDLKDEPKYYPSGKEEDAGPNNGSKVMQVVKRSIFYPVEVNSVHEHNWSVTDFSGGFYRELGKNLKHVFGRADLLLEEIEQNEAFHSAQDLRQLRAQWSAEMKKAANAYRRQVAWVDLKDLPEIVTTLAKTKAAGGVAGGGNNSGRGVDDPLLGNRQQEKDAAGPSSNLNSVKTVRHNSSPRNLKAILEFLPYLERRFANSNWDIDMVDLRQKLQAAYETLVDYDDREKNRKDDPDEDPGAAINLDHRELQAQFFHRVLDQQSGRALPRRGHVVNEHAPAVPAARQELHSASFLHQRDGPLLSPRSESVVPGKIMLMNRVLNNSEVPQALVDDEDMPQGTTDPGMNHPENSNVPPGGSREHDQNQNLLPEQPDPKPTPKITASRIVSPGSSTPRELSQQRSGPDAGWGQQQTEGDVEQRVSRSTDVPQASGGPPRGRERAGVEGEVQEGKVEPQRTSLTTTETTARGPGLIFQKPQPAARE